MMYTTTHCAVDYCREKARYEKLYVCGLPLTVALCKAHSQEIRDERAERLHSPR